MAFLTASATLGVTVPTFGIYSTEGEWIVENHGVDPDIEVDDDPTAMARGGDPQLERLVLGFASELSSNALEVHVSSLRRKLGRDLVETVRGLGYRVAALP